MYFPQAIQESVLFTVKNVLDYLFLPSQKELYTKRKVEEAEREFYKYYTTSFKTDKELRFAINVLTTDYDILDIFEIKKFMRHDLVYMDKLPDTHKNITPQQAYSMFFYMKGADKLPDYKTSYIFPYLLDQRNIIYIVYDENAIKGIYILGSKNIHDFTEPITFIRLDQRNIIDKSIFKKS